MRTIERASAFKRDYQQVKATPDHAKDVDVLLSALLTILLIDEPLPAHYRDHGTEGKLVGIS